MPIFELQQVRAKFAMGCGGSGDFEWVLQKMKTMDKRIFNIKFEI